MVGQNLDEGLIFDPLDGSKSNAEALTQDVKMLTVAPWVELTANDLIDTRVYSYLMPGKMQLSIIVKIVMLKGNKTDGMAQLFIPKGEHK